MNTNRSLISTLALALMVTPALAQTGPIFSGKYIGNYNRTCEALQSTANPGSTIQGTFVSNFDRDSGTVQIDGTGSRGALVVWTGGSEGMTQIIVHKNFAYSNDATTFTFNGTVFNAVYGALGNGIAHSAMLSGLLSTDCAVSVVLIRE